jgi:23S rRNA (uracil1939-C5)-methyltransferase
MQLTVKSLNHQGVGIAHHEGKTVFVNNALPDETVAVQITKRHKRYDEAVATEIITASKDRVEPICPHFQVCGGCMLQHMKSDAQIALKQQVLMEQLQHFAQATPDNLLPLMSGVSQGYRRKARLGVKFVEKKNKLLIGFREQNNRYLADIETCPVLVPKIGQSFSLLRDMLMQLSNYRSIAQIELAAGDDITALIFRHLEPLTDQDIKIFQDYGQTHDIHIYLQPKGPETVHCIWPNSPKDLTYSLAVEQLTLAFHPLDFVQVNADINQQMVKRVLEVLDLNKNDTVLDLFSGLGNFTLPMAKRAGQVVGVEGSPVMVARLLENAKRNHLENVSAFAADLSKPIDGFAWARQTYNKIVLDPPRTGALELVQQIKQFQASIIVYISCHPATLARDTKIIIEQGYHLQAAGAIDMFPHTMHVESMAVFVRKK